MLFLQWLQQGFESIKIEDINSPTIEVRPTEIVIGRLDDSVTQKMFTLRDVLSKELDKFQREAAHTLIDMAGEEQSPDHNPMTCKSCSLRRKYTQLTERAKLLDTLFWDNVRNSLSDGAVIELEKAGGVIGIRQGWQIVGFRSTPTLSLIDILAL